MNGTIGTVDAAVVAWLGTYLVHSTLLLGGAWLVTRALGTPRLREVVWRTALAGGLVSASLLMAIGGGGLVVDGTALLRRGGEADGRGEGLALLAAGGGAPPGAVVEAASPARDGRLAVRQTTFELPPAAGAADGSWTLSLGGLELGPAALLVAAWLAWAAVGVGRLLRRRRRLVAVLAGRRELRAGPLVEALRALRAEHGPRRRVRLSASALVDSPMALGWAEICVPEYALDELGSGSTGALLAHELAHLRRRDSAWGLAAALLARLFPFQPLLRVAERRLRAEAELCCDSEAVRATVDGAGLARCLLEVAERTAGAGSPAWAAAMAVPRGELVARVEAALAGGAPRPSRALLGTTVAASWVALAALACVGPGVRAGEEQPLEVTGGATLGRSGMRTGSLAYQLSGSADPADGRDVLSVWINAELVHRAPTDDPAADLERVQREHGVIPGPATTVVELDGSGRRTSMPAGEERRDSVGPLGPRVVDTPGPTGPRTPDARVVLEIDGSGAIRAGEQVLVPAGGTDLGPLREHLAAAARGMPKDTQPGLLPLPRGLVQVIAPAQAPFASMLAVVQQCGMADVQIQQLELGAVLPDGSETTVSYRLPTYEDLDEERADAPARFTVELRGPGVTLRVPPEMGTGFSSRRARLDVLGGMVSTLVVPHPAAVFLLDVHDPTTVGETLAVLRTLRDAGARTLGFVGRRE